MCKNPVLQAIRWRRSRSREGVEGLRPDGQHPLDRHQAARPYGRTEGHAAGTTLRMPPG